MKSGQLLVVNFATIPEAGLIRRAREVARALGKELFICCLLDDAELPPLLPGRRERVRRVRKKLVERCKNALEKVLDDLNAAGVVAHGYVKTAAAVKEAALNLVEKQSPACVLICRGQHTRFQEATLSGPDFAIIRSCPVPVWVVNPANDSGDKVVGAINRAGAGGDGELLDEKILVNAARLAEKLGKESHALHTFGEAGFAQELEPAARDEDDDMGASRYDRRMNKVFDFGEAHGMPRERIHIHEGKLVNALEEMSGSMNADLIILGARPNGRWSRLLSGSAVERVVQRVNTDVLVLKSGGPQAADERGLAQ